MTRLQALAVANRMTERALGAADVSAPTRARLVHTIFAVIYHEAPSSDARALVGADYFGDALAVGRLYRDGVVNNG